MKIKTTPAEIWRELEKGQQYKENLNLYDTVKRNENFYIGKQWEGVKAPDLEKPVLNFLRRVVTYFIAMIVSDDVAVSFTPFDPVEGDDTGDILAHEVDRVLECTKARSKNRLAVRDAAVDGDCACYLWFDPDARTGRVGDGEIRMELVDNAKLIFGDPYKAEVQEQPYLIIVRRCLLETVRERAGENGQNPEDIRADNDRQYYGEEADTGDLVTTALKLWKQGDTVWAAEVTRDGVVVPPKDTGCKLYPVAWMNWEAVKNSYHGAAAITGLIPNQIYVNKLWAMFAQHQKTMAFPKLFYDSTKIQKWTNKVGEAIAVTGDPNQAFASSFRAGDVSGQAMELVEKTITYTKEFMGASDAALGNVKPDNTSAIIAVQKASSAPLELQRMAFWQFVEDYTRIILDMIRVRYGLREVSWQDDDGITQRKLVDFSALPYDAMEMNVEVGASAYWSELAQIQTLDGLFAKGIITDAVDYLEGVPSKYIPHKDKLLKKLKEQQAQMEQMGGMENGAMPQVQNLPDGAPLLGGA